MALNPILLVTGYIVLAIDMYSHGGSTLEEDPGSFAFVANSVYDAAKWAYDQEWSLKDANGNELKAWTAIANYMKSMEDTDGNGIPNMDEKYAKEGMLFAGMNPDSKLVEIVELKTHPYFIGVIFEPENKSQS